MLSRPVAGDLWAWELVILATVVVALVNDHPGTLACGLAAVITYAVGLQDG